MPADALTVSPYLGVDALAPLVTAARANGRGLFVLVKTSNPGAGKLQDLEAAGDSVYQHVARALVPAAAAMVGPRTGWSSLGVVVGATYPDDARRVRETLPRALFLVPGFGAQGAGAEDAVRGLPVAEDGRREGGLVNASRAILFPEGSADATRARYVRLLDDAIAGCADALARAVSARA
jgi:orotidine-5'-phosphate decarboxylase